MKNNENQLHSNYAVVPFDSILIGKSLREVSSEFSINDNESVESRWFHSDKDADLFFWLNKNQDIIKQQLTFFGQVTEWSLSGGLKTGLIIEDEISQKIKSSPLIQYDITIQVHSLVQGVEILKHVPGLSIQHRLKIISNFSSQIDQKYAIDMTQDTGLVKSQPPLFFLKKIWLNFVSFVRKNLRF